MLNARDVAREVAEREHQDPAQRSKQVTERPQRDSMTAKARDDSESIHQIPATVQSQIARVSKVGGKRSAQDLEESCQWMLHARYVEGDVAKTLVSEGTER